MVAVGDIDRGRYSSLAMLFFRQHFLWPMLLPADIAACLGFLKRMTF
jgi:hypothetical protein